MQKLKNILPQAHLKDFKEGIQNYVELTKPAYRSLSIFRSARTPNSMAYSHSEPINTQWLANIFKGNKNVFSRTRWKLEDKERTSRGISTSRTVQQMSF